MNVRQIRKQRCSMKDVNFRIPEDFTSILALYLPTLSESPKVNYLRSQCFSKFVSSDTAPADVRRNRAVNKWLAAERNNEATNVRLLTTRDDFNILPHVQFDAFVAFAQDLVRSIVNDVPSDEALFGSFSGGASTSRNRTQSHPALKYLGKADATSPALDVFRHVLEFMPGWTGHRTDADVVNVVPGNVMFTVAKNADIDRCACKEPDINMFIQKGFGGEIRRCLRRQGIDLNDQSKNRVLAHLGSVNGSLTTLDLSSASDSVTTELVRMLLPDIWFQYLSDLRSPVTDVFGELHCNEMFSSMGNGFTFELQSLLFYVLARSTAYFRGISGVISVYGDDIICPSALTHDLMWVLSYFGFEINTSKSFWDGPFRESCGGHYYNGTDITPFYVKEPVIDLLGLIHLGNSIRKWSSIHNYVLDEEMYPLWEQIRNMVPKQFWGGRDLDSKEALVTSDLPRKRIVVVTRRQDTGTGGYVQWLNATSRRSKPTDEAVETSFRTIERPLYRARPNTTPYTHMMTPRWEAEWRT